MAWVVLVLAGLFEIVMALSLKLSNGFSNLWWTLSFAVTAVLSFGLLAYALKKPGSGHRVRRLDRRRRGRHGHPRHDRHGGTRCHPRG
ncbi:hypothetical protein GCM10020001_038150 [Nonomuraea salmonea]